MITRNHQLFLVSSGSIRYVTWAVGREEAKRNARSWIGDDSDRYIVTPLSERGDRVHVNLTLSV